MAFSYAPSSSVNTQPLAFGSGLNYGAPNNLQAQQQQQQQLNYSNQFPAQQQQQTIDPKQLKQMYDIYQQFSGGGSTMGQGNLSGLLSSSGGSGGLGGSGLIGSAGGATSAAGNGGASFGLGGSLVGGTGEVGSSTFAAGAGESAGGLGSLLGGGGGAASGGAAAGGAGASGAGGLASAGPWGLLAAVILANEADSSKKGLRSENKGERAKDMLSGKVLTQDIDGKWGPEEDRLTGGLASKGGFVGDQKGFSQIASGRIAPGLKSIWNDGTLSKIRNIF